MQHYPFNVNIHQHGFIKEDFTESHWNVESHETHNQEDDLKLCGPHSEAPQDHSNYTHMFNMVSMKRMWQIMWPR